MFVVLNNEHSNTRWFHVIPLNYTTVVMGLVFKTISVSCTDTLSHFPVAGMLRVSVQPTCCHTHIVILFNFICVIGSLLVCCVISLCKIKGYIENWIMPIVNTIASVQFLTPSLSLSLSVCVIACTTLLWILCGWVAKCIPKWFDLMKVLQMWPCFLLCLSLLGTFGYSQSDIEMFSVFSSLPFPLFQFYWPLNVNTEYFSNNFPISFAECDNFFSILYLDTKVNGRFSLPNNLFIDSNHLNFEQIISMPQNKQQ